MDNKCCAICVTYNPDYLVLRRVLAACAEQVGRVYVVDNGSREDVTSSFSGFANVEAILLGQNKGIAAAINAAIRQARIDGFRFVLLLDQDSVIPKDMIPQYLAAFEQLLVAGQSVAVIGPRYKDARTGQISHFVRFKWFRNAYYSGTDGSLVVPIDFLISSGSFYSIDIFEAVGMFDETLFIDHVDTEWCLRAASLGFQCFGIREVIMEHALGEGGVRLWLFRWRTQPMHKPFRLYYIARNSLLLYQMQHVPLKWVSGDVLRLVRLFLMYTFFSTQRFAAIRCYFCGIIDGLRGVAGPRISHRRCG